MSSNAFVSSFAPVHTSAAQRSSFTPQTAPVNTSAPARSPRPASVPCMLFNFFPGSLTTDKKVVDIPQKAANVPERKEKLDAARAKYEWKYEGIADAALIKKVPFPEELPQPGWVAELFEIILRIALNLASNSAEEAIKNSVLVRVTKASTSVTVKILTGQVSLFDFEAVLKELGEIMSPTVSGKAVTIKDHKDLFDVIRLDTVAKLDQFLRDDVFGFYRVAGANPMRLTKLTVPVTDLFPGMTDEILQGIPSFSGDTLAAAAQENRLYYVDYEDFKDVPAGVLEGVPKESFVYAPKALLAVPRVTTARKTLLPIAIYCGQDDSFPMYSANKQHTDEVAWIAAKYTVQNADAVAHELIYHLGRCHILGEAIACALHRALPDVHPLFRLIKPHVYGTPLINAAAVATLTNPGGIVDNLVAADIGVANKCAAASVSDSSFSFNDWMPDVELAARGVMDSVLEFPYRDDVLAHWGAINKLVKSVVYTYYASDADVVGDYELQAFGKELAVDGKVNGFGEGADGAIKTRDYLVRAVSMMIFTVTVQHAAMNFSQSTHMQFVPAMTLGAYAPAPKSDKPFASVNEWVNKMVPDLEYSQRTLSTMELIGGLRYTKLGEYGWALRFAGDEVEDALVEYQEELSLIGGRIQQRNREERNAGLPVYNHLVPKNVPMSINI